MDSDGLDKEVNGHVVMISPLLTGGMLLRSRVTPYCGSMLHGTERSGDTP